ncbi:hypothetical protein E2562_027728 [Oryza meyeriana var. granulata]|uniref:FBD domain-containing protein n=1 Tax=Oryza meyeriana var. granulata TaxID=110450 RepID=A0A6G1EQL8_9ORYZ|nr:hypothetical protein E2562_027728 [Oryza meyeriana var. granulata]
MTITLDRMANASEESYQRLREIPADHPGACLEIHHNTSGVFYEFRSSDFIKTPDDHYYARSPTRSWAASCAACTPSSRRRVWLAVPAFSFHGRVRDCLAAYAARTDLPLRGIDVVTVRAPAGSTGEFLRLAARCLSGELVFVNETPGEDEEGLAVDRGVCELPCFENATKIRMRLGFLGLRMPSSGVFRRLTRVMLIHSLDNEQYMMDDITMVPHVEKLFLRLSSGLHAYGACVFHVLQMCTGVGKLIVDLQSWKVPSECPLGCICGQPNDWKTEHISLIFLKK